MCFSSGSRNAETIIDTEKKEGKRDHYSLLEARLIKIIGITKITRMATDSIARVNPISLLAISIMISILFGIFAALMGEKTEIYVELKTPLRVSNDFAPPIKVPEKYSVRRENEIQSYFDENYFKTALLVIALLLAFARWQIGNSQSAMSEMFERKQAVNNLIIEKQDSVKPLISDALDLTRKNQNARKTKFTINERDELVNNLKNERNSTSQEDCFEQQMFVYIELDNLEFAQMKFKAGYLDAEQMVRACEIFESRCVNVSFRRLAAIHGTDFYTDDFHDLVKTLILFGFAHSNDNKVHEEDLS